MQFVRYGDVARISFAAIRKLCTIRNFSRVALGLGFAMLFVVGSEALLRARIPDAGDRMPSALYTRPVPWGVDRAPRAPVVIGPLAGGAAEERVPLKLADVPDRLVQAILAVEDQRFFEHHGIDVRRIGGALVANVRAGGITQGGSTLTQQLAKNLFLSASRSPLRKVREAAMAVVLEKRYDKAQLLEAYLNEIYLGQDGARAIHGVGAAARFYFAKDVRKLTLAEAALMAAMISAPNHNAPDRHPEVARQRRDLVLQLMADQHRITQASADQASRADVPTNTHAAATFDARAFRDVALPSTGKRLPARGAAVYSTLDARLQRAAEHAVESGLDRLHAPDLQAALVAIDPRNGEVLAMVGGRDYGASQFNRATAASRQPGSAFKPIVALTALDRTGAHAPLFTLASVVADEPLSVETASGLWQPVDHDGTYRGEVTLREAMEQSLNIPFARIGMTIGPRNIVATAHRVGITSSLDAVPSLALGSSGVSLLELVRAYGVLATGGNLSTTRMFVGEGHYGDSIRIAPPATATRVVDPAVAYLVTSALEGVIARGTGRALSAQGHEGAIAGKTGTSNNGRDAWFIAYSTSLVVGVWVGYDDSRDLHMTGAAAALPVVSRFLADATTDADFTEFPVPDGITVAQAGGGDNALDSGCGEREYFLVGTEPSEHDCERVTIPGIIEWGGRLGRDAGKDVLRLIAREWRLLRGATR